MDRYSAAVYKDNYSNHPFCALSQLNYETTHSFSREHHTLRAAIKYDLHSIMANTFQSQGTTLNFRTPYDQKIFFINTLN
jgi:hypothetical protein